MPFKLKRGGRDMEEVEIGAKDVIGITEEELKTSLDKVAGIDDIKTKQTEQDTVLNNIQTTLAALEGRIPKAKVNNDGEGHTEEEDVDPNVRALGYAVQTSLEAKIDVLKNKMANNQEKYPYWEQFETDMLKLTEKDPIQSKTLEQYWDNVYSIIFARNYKKIQDGTIKAKRTMYVETGTSHSGTEQKDDNTPSELDKIQAAKFKIPIEKYMETKKQLQFQR